MRCSKAREYISRHLDEDLPPKQTGELDRHLDACADCRAHRADLALGRRLLAATEPEPPENFDWKLRLQLNRTLRETAGETVLPWHEGTPGRWSFLRAFGGAAAAGLAAVLSVAMFVGPQLAPRGAAVLAEGGAAGPAGSAPTAAAVADTDRLPLYQRAGRPLFTQVGSGPGLTRAGLTGRAGDDGAAWITTPAPGAEYLLRLERDNQRLRALVNRYEKQIEFLRTRLDTTGRDALDLRYQR